MVASIAVMKSSFSFFTAEDVDDYDQSESNLNNTRGLLQPTAQESERWVFVVNCLA